MKKFPWKTYAAWVLLIEAVGGLAGWLTREGTKLYTEQIVQPPLSPPAIVPSSPSVPDSAARCVRVSSRS